jgi:hypothetical protein
VTRALLLAVAFWCVPAVAQAQPTTAATLDVPELRLLPEYTPCTVAGVRFACFTADQVAQLNALEARAHGLEEQLHLSENLRLELDQLVINLHAQIADYVVIDTASTARILELTTQLGHEIDQKNQYRVQAESTDYWPYVVGAVVGILGVGFGVGAAVLR